MKVLVTGVNGQLGYDVMLELSQKGHIGIGSDIQLGSPNFENYIQLDVTDEGTVKALVSKIKPDAVIHCAAWTAVDLAEENKELVYAINALGPKYIAETTAFLNIPMIQISTDYVFDGKGDKPYEVDSPKAGLSTYGRSKAQGEDFVININPKHFIVRITGAFGKNGNNFIKIMLKLANAGKKELSVVNDQIVSVTYTKDLAVLLVEMIQTEKYGIYHAANEGYFSWFDFAKEIFAEAHKNVVVCPITAEKYKEMVPRQADRPKNSRLSMRTLIEAGFHPLPSHTDALRRYLKEIGE
jgi:dTDP-4-dehydrorhamnose reductase